MHVSSLIIVASLMVGLRTEVVDLQFCSGTSTVINNTVSELNFYKDPGFLTTPRVDINIQCKCHVTLYPFASLVTLKEAAFKMSCYDYVSVFYGSFREEQRLRCLGSQISLYDVTEFDLILNEATQGDGEDTVTPVKVMLEPKQTSGLSVTCDVGVSVSVTSSFSLSTTRASDSSTTSSTPTTIMTSSPAVNATATLGPSREANYTPLVVGVVAAGVIVGACLVCVIAWRIKRQRNPNQARFRETVHRKASSMLQSIKLTRPLPKLPKLKPKPSGQYNTIKPQSTRAVNPDIKSKSATDPSDYYLHPIHATSNKPHTPEMLQTSQTQQTSPTPNVKNVDKAVDSDDGTYLTQVILSESGKHNMNRKQNNSDNVSAHEAPEARADNDTLDDDKDIAKVITENDTLEDDPDHVKVADEDCGGHINTTYEDDEDDPYMFAVVCIDDNDPKSSKGNTDSPQRQTALDISLKADTQEPSDDYMNMARVVNSESTDYLIPLSKDRLMVENEHDDYSGDNDNERVSDDNDIESDNRAADDSKDVNNSGKNFHRGIDDTFPKLLMFKTVSNASSDVGVPVKADEKPKAKRYVREIVKNTEGNSKA